MRYYQGAYTDKREYQGLKLIQNAAQDDLQVVPKI